MHSFRSELRYAVRGFLRQPAFAAAVIVTLALGIGTTTSMFSVADAELWRPLPFPNPHELVAIYSRGPEPRASNDPVSGADLIEWRKGAPALKDIAGYGRSVRRTLRAGLAESVRVSTVTPNYFSALGRQAIVGATTNWTSVCGPDAAVVTERAWRRLFGGDPAIVGKVVPLDETNLVICGVVADDYSIGTNPDFFLAFDEHAPSFLDRAEPVIVEGVIGRLDGDTDIRIAAEQLNATAARIAAEFPAGRSGHTVGIEDLHDYWRGDYNRSRLYFFLGAAITVLILSWVNVASLLLSRAVRRTREFAVRGALGGGRAAIARMLLAEGVVLAVAAGVLGIIITVWTTELFTANLPVDFLRGGDSVPVDIRAWAFAITLTALTVSVFCLAPYFGTRRLDLVNALRSDTRAGRSGREGRATSVLLTAQIALTVILMAGAGIFLKSFAALTQAPLGFDPVDAVAVRATLSGSRYNTDLAVRAFAEDVRGRLSATAGIRDVAIATSSPMGSGPLMLLARPDQPKPAPGEETRSIFRAVSPEYFRTLKVRVVRGREFGDGDVAGSPRVAIINEVAARRLFGSEDPIGRDVELLDSPRANRWTRRPGIARIVGIAANIKEVGVHEVEFADIYLPYAQAPSASVEFVLRTAVPLNTLREPVQKAIAGADPAIPMTSIMTFTDRVSTDLRGGRFNALLVATFAGLAILLAIVGIHAAMTYAVAGKTREFGVRLALGARPSALIRATLAQSGRIGLIGGALGITGVLVIARLLGDAWYLVPGKHNGLLYEVTTTDPIVLTASFAGVIVVAIAAATMPARRVGSVDPVTALRSE
jgi:putative ABC transport system permease protein